MAAEGKAIIFYRCNLFFYFVSIDERPATDLNQTWPVGRKWCRFTNASKKFRRALPKFGAQKHQISDHFFRDFRIQHRISPERNVASTNKNANVNIQCVPKKLNYFP